MRRSLTFLGWPLLVVPQISLWFGVFLNQLATVVNGGAMPVLWNSMNPWQPDPTHLMMTPATHLKFFCDWIVVPDGVMSVGDIFITLSDITIGPFFWMWVGYVLYRAIQSEIYNIQPIISETVDRVQPSLN